MISELKFYLLLDRVIIPLYRLVDDPLIGFFLGTFLLAFITVVIGEFTISFVFLANKSYLDRLNNELIKWNNLSVEAIEAGDKEAYKIFNDRANEVFGKVLFFSIAYSAASLWPAPFALGWMQYRFFSVEFPLPFKVPYLGDSVGYIFVFVLLYILAKLVFLYLKPYLPYFRRIKAILDEYDKEGARLKSFADLMEKSGGVEKAKGLEGRSGT